MSLTEPRPSQRGHMPPVMLNSRRSLIFCPERSTVTAPAPLIEATLKENACGEPMCGRPSRLNRMRSIALASVAVPTVERGSAPIRSWSMMIAVVSPSSTSTSGRAWVGMNPCTNALYVSLIIRWDSAAIVANTSELLPDPDTPVNTVSRRLGSSMLTSLRLFSRAPRTRIRSWVSATCTAGACGSVVVAVLIDPPSVARAPVYRIAARPGGAVLGRHARPARSARASRILIAWPVSYGCGVRRFLGSVWREPRAPDAPRRVWWDWLLTGALVAAALAEGVLRSELRHPGVWVPIAVLLAVALLWRRTRPLPVVAVTFTATAVATLALAGEPSGLYTLAAALLLPYALFRWASGRDVLIGVAFLLVGLAEAALTSGNPGDAGAGAGALSASVALGLAVRFRARARTRELDQVKLLERERLARDLHDTVAHHVSAMA